MHKRIIMENINAPLIYVSDTTIDNNFQATPHSHPNLEILLVTKGRGFMKMYNLTLPVQVGDIVFIGPNVTHYEISSVNLRFYALGILEESVIRSDIINSQNFVFHLRNKVYQSVVSIYHTIYREAEEKKKNYELIIENSLTTLLFLLNREIEVKPLNGDDLNSDFYAGNLKQLLDNYYYINFSLSDLAKRNAMSVSTISHHFKEKYGVGIIEYKINRQIDEAKNLLKISDMNIVEIGTAVGFNSPSYFTKVFKERIGSSPSEYRKIIKANEN